MEVPNWAIDCPDDRDFHFESLFWDVTHFKKDFPYKELKVWNQGLDHRTAMSCTRCGGTHITNAQNIQEIKLTGKIIPEINPFVRWEEYLKENPDAQRNGASLQSELRQMKKHNDISGYSVVRTLEEIMQAIDIWQYIYTGSQTGDWTYVRTDMKFRRRTDGKIVGHVFPIVDYKLSERVFICLNSYWPANWYFSLSFDDIKELFTMYAIADFPNQEAKDIFLSHKQSLMTNTANSKYSKTLNDLRLQTNSTPLFSDYLDAEWVTKELIEIGILRSKLWKKD